MSKPTFDFTKHELKSIDLSTTSILNKVSEIVLWRYYLGVDFIIGTSFSAPYRRDANPSFCIFKDRRGRIMGKDFGRGFYGDIFNYIQMIRSCDLYQACAIINYDFDLDLGFIINFDDFSGRTKSIEKVKPLSQATIKKLDKLGESIVSNSNKIQVVVRKYKQSDLQYWNQFGIDYSLLKTYNVYCAERVYCNNKICYQYTKDDPGYIYYFPKSGHVKIYYPLRQKFRFMGNVNNYEDIQGYWQCQVKNKEVNFLILTKSMKDCMTIRKFGFDSISIHGEKHRFHKDFIRHIKKYYSCIISLYDRDLSGMNGAKYLWRDFEIKPYFINKKYMSKDISDLYKNHGSEITLNFLNQIKQKQDVCHKLKS